MRYSDANMELMVLRSICDAPEGPEYLGRLTAEYFGQDETKQIFNRIVTFVGAGKPIPPVEMLKSDAALNDAARALISAPLTNKPLDKENFEHAHSVLAKYRKARILLRCAEESLAQLKENDPDVDAVVANLEALLTSCHTGQTRTEMYHITADRVEELVEDVRQELDREVDDVIPSSFMEFDKKTGGFRRRNVIALASVPGGGKSAMAEQMAINQFMMGFNVCLVSYEMDEVESKYRMLSCISKVDHGAINLKKLQKKQKEWILEEWRRYILASGRKNRFTIWTPTTEMNIPEMATILKPMGYDIIYVDYIGLLKQYKDQQQHESLGNHARAAKLAANSMNAAWVLLAQLDDESLKIKYSKAIIANVHFAWMWENDDKAKESGIVTINQLKARNAEVYPFLLQRDFRFMTFQDYIGLPPTKLPEAQKSVGLPRMSELA